MYLDDGSGPYCDECYEIKKWIKKMTQNEFDFLLRRWVKLKKIETRINEMRRVIEDTILSNLDPAFSKLQTSDGIKVSISKTDSVKINSEILQDLAEKSGITETLNTLFRWKPELEKKSWKKASASIREALAPAISIQKTRPSFKLEK